MKDKEAVCKCGEKSADVKVVWKIIDEVDKNIFRDIRKLIVSERIHKWKACGWIQALTDSSHHMNNLHNSVIKHYEGRLITTTMILFCASLWSLITHYLLMTCFLYSFLIPYILLLVYYSPWPWHCLALFFFHLLLFVEHNGRPPLWQYKLLVTLLF